MGMMSTIYYAQVVTPATDELKYHIARCLEESVAKGGEVSPVSLTMLSNSVRICKAVCGTYVKMVEDEKLLSDSGDTARPAESERDDHEEPAQEAAMAAAAEVGLHDQGDPEGGTETESD